MATIRKRGDKWQAQVRRRGYHSVSKSFAAKADAQTWGRFQESQIDKAALPRNLNDLKRLTLGDLLKRYQLEITPRKRSARHERNRIQRLLQDRIASISLAHLSPSNVATFRDVRLREVGPQAVRHDLNLLGHVVRIASLEWGVGVPPNLLSEIKKPKLPNPRDRRLRKGEMEKVERVLSKGVTPDYLGGLIALAIETALRKSELLSLEWNDIDLTSRIALITKTKNGYPRKVPLSGKAVEALASQKGRDPDRVFPASVPALRFHWDRLLLAAGIEDLHFHDLRHEAISRLFEKGLSVPEVALISGHRDYRQLFRYTHLRAEDLVKKI